MQSPPSMVTRSGDSLVVRSVVSGNALFVNDETNHKTNCQTSVNISIDDQDENVEYLSLDEAAKKLPQCKVKRNYACSSCNYFTQNPRHYLYHLRDVHREKVKISECSECLYASRNFQKLIRHTKIVHGKTADNVLKNQTQAGKKIATNPTVIAPETVPFRRTRKRKHLKPSIVEALRRNSNESIISDEEHQPKFVMKKSTHAKNPIFKCSLCSFTTKNQMHLTRHEKQDHIKTKFFRCVKCNYVTHIKARYTKHVKYHSMPMIKCDLCDFRTPYKWNLDRHYKNHNGHGAFKCNSCNFTADIKQSLTVHEMNHHTPPVGQAAGSAIGTGISRRRNKVGASDVIGNLPSDEVPSQQQKETKPFLNDYENIIDVPFSAQISNYNLNEVLAKAGDTKPIVNKKKSRPIPNLIPIQNSVKPVLRVPKYTNEQAVLSPISISQQDLNELCARSTNSSLRDFTSLFGDESPLRGMRDKYTDVVEITPIKNLDIKSSSGKKQVFSSTPSQHNNAAYFHKKNASFFDKLKEKLMTGAGSTDTNSLTCKGCGHVSKCLSETAGHLKLCGKYVELSAPTQDHLSVVFGSTRCQLCRQRCKSSADLYHHMKTCSKTEEPDEKSIETPDDSGSFEIPEEQVSDSSRHTPHPMENVVFVWNSLPERETNTNLQKLNTSTFDDSTIPMGIDLCSSSSTRVDSPSVASENSFLSVLGTSGEPHRINSKPVTHGTDRDLASAAAWKKVFKCPHCSFWATTASRFHVHIVGHLNKKPFECSLCSYRSNWRWDITKHIRLKSVRDSAHERAKVLMTDETGRRNYSKYNKYLTQIQRDANGDKAIISSVQKSKDNDQTNNNLSPYNATDLSIKNEDFSIKHIDENDFASISVRSKKPVPALKPADVNQYPNNCKQRNDEKKTKESPNGGGKKTLWKCKRCNFKDNDKSVLLQHVKEHYRLEGIRQAADGSTCSNLTDERHCRLKHQGDVRVIIGGTNGSCEKVEIEDQSDDCIIVVPGLTENKFNKIPNEFHGRNENDHLDIDAVLRCPSCSFCTGQKQDFLEHCMSHSTLDMEKELNDGLPHKRYGCVACPYVSNSKSQYLYHKQFHKPRGAPHKCTLCSYNVTRRHLLHQHLKIHGIGPPSKNSYHVDNFEEGMMTEDIDMSEINLAPENFLDIPLVWLQRDDKFFKIYQCRYCPFTNVQKIAVQDHEKMHFIESETEFKCSQCSFKCNNSTMFTSHMKYHDREYGIIHCLVDPEKSDEEQISQLSQLCCKISLDNDTNENSFNKDLNENIESEMCLHENIDEDIDKMLYFCDNCPARFLVRKEFDIHMKLHNSRYLFKCSCCTYTARQNAHLLAHIKVHTEEYQNKTKLLQMTYSTSSQHVQPNTTILMNVPDMDNPVWVVVSSGSGTYLRDEFENEVSVCKVSKKTVKNELGIYEERPYKTKSKSIRTKTTSVPISGTDLYNQKFEVQKQAKLAPQIGSSPPPSLHVDPQFGILMHGSPEFIYPTYIKNGKTKEKRYKCHKCPSAFEKREQYKVHLSLHGSKQRYRCDHCDYSVKYYANYVQHVRKHQMNADAQAARKKDNENSGSTENDVSDNVLSQDSGSTSHYAIKTMSSPDAQGPLKLSVADKQSLMIIQQRRSNYTESYKEPSVDDKKLLWCPHCPYTTHRRDALENHIKRHVSVSGYNSNYTCTHCDYSVPQSHFLREHVKLHFLPMKNNKLDAYMICNKLELLVNDVNENKVEKTIFKDNGDFSERQRFNPVLDDVDCLSEDDQDKIYIDPSSGEPKTKSNDDNSSDSDGTDKKDSDKTKETLEDTIVIKKAK